MEKQYIKLFQLMLGMPYTEIDGIFGAKTKKYADDMIDKIQSFMSKFL